MASLTNRSDEDQPCLNARAKVCSEVRRPAALRASEILTCQDVTREGSTFEAATGDRLARGRPLRSEPVAQPDDAVLNSTTRAVKNRCITPILAPP